MSSVQYRSRRCLALLLFFAISSGWAQIPADSLKDAYSRLVKLDNSTLSLSDSERSQRLADAYDAGFAPALKSPKLADVPSEDLEILSQASQRLAYYTNDERYLRDMMKVMDAFGSSAGPGALKRFHQTLLQFRRFDDAKRLARKYPEFEFESVPEVVEAGSNIRPNAYAIDQGSEQLKEIQVPLRGETLVVVVHPRCGFSVRAMDALRQHPLLRGLKVVWLAPVGLHLDYEALKRWNMAHTDQSIVLARHITDWPMIGRWETPTFYLLQDGNVIADFSGWPNEGSWPQLQELLAKRSEKRADAEAVGQ